MGPTKPALQLVQFNVRGEYCPEVLFGHLVPFNISVKEIVQCAGFGPGSWLYYYFFNERFIAPIHIETYMTVTKLFRNYHQFTTVP
jgi:hypothetical protein